MVQRRTHAWPYQGPLDHQISCLQVPPSGLSECDFYLKTRLKFLREGKDSMDKCFSHAGMTSLLNSVPLRKKILVPPPQKKKTHLKTYLLRKPSFKLMVVLFVIAEFLFYLRQKCHHWQTMCTRNVQHNYNQYTWVVLTFENFFLWRRERTFRGSIFDPTQLKTNCLAFFQESAFQLYKTE